MLVDAIVRNVWMAIPVWACLYISDYALTLVGSRLYQRGANKHMVFQGSYELTPIFQKDVDALRKISPKFVVILVLSCVGIWVLWRAGLSMRSLRGFEFVMGALILAEIGVDFRHVRNIVMLKLALRSDGVKGRIEYSRSFLLRASSAEWLGFAVLFLLLALVSHPWFFLGGAAHCFALGLQHWSMSDRARLKEDRAVETLPPS